MIPDIIQYLLVPGSGLEYGSNGPQTFLNNRAQINFRQHLDSSCGTFSCYGKPISFTIIYFVKVVDKLSD
jgi:hypothetical protein